MYTLCPLISCLPALDYIQKHLEKELKSPSRFFNQHLTTCFSAGSLAVMFENALLEEFLTDSAETGGITGKSTFLSKDLNERYIEILK